MCHSFDLGSAQRLPRKGVGGWCTITAAISTDQSYTIESPPSGLEHDGRDKCHLASDSPLSHPMQSTSKCRYSVLLWATLLWFPVIAMACMECMTLGHRKWQVTWMLYVWLRSCRLIQNETWPQGGSRYHEDAWTEIHWKR